MFEAELYYFNSATVLQSVGDRVEVSWPSENQFHSGTISTLDELWRHKVNYDDGDQEKLNSNAERWRFMSSVASGAATMVFGKKLQSTEQVILRSVLE